MKGRIGDKERVGRGRVVFLVRLKPGSETAFLASYEQIRHAVAAVEGHIVDQLCRAPDDPLSWLITSEWRSLEDFQAWERLEAHRELVRPMRECIDERTSLRFVVQAETRGRFGQTGPSITPSRRTQESNMERTTVNGVELEYETEGAGEPIVLIHGGLLAQENGPLVRERALTERYRVVNYHRRGFAGSTKADGPSSIALQADDCRALMDHLDIDRAHVVGHSLGGTIAVQLALDAPDRVQSLALLEPALMSAFAKAQGGQRPEVAAVQQSFAESLARVRELFEAGDRRGALEAFLESRAGEAFRGVMEYLVRTGEFEQAVADADTFLLRELPAGFAWTFTPADAARIRQPILSVLGVHSPVRAQKVDEILRAWIPQTERAVLPNAEHALPLMDPPGIAETLAQFFARHPISAAVAR